MIAAAGKRNAGFIATGKAEFLVGLLEEIDLGERRFDKIFAVRVRLFASHPDRARELAERWLAPDGRLSWFYDEPSA